MAELKLFYQVYIAQCIPTAWQWQQRTQKVLSNDITVTLSVACILVKMKQIIPRTSEPQKYIKVSMTATNPVQLHQTEHRRRSSYMPTQIHPLTSEPEQPCRQSVCAHTRYQQHRNPCGTSYSCHNTSSMYVSYKVQY